MRECAEEREGMRERKRVQSREGVWMRKRGSVDENERDCGGEKEC